MLGIGDPFARWTDAGGLATPPGNMERDLALVTLPAGTRAVVGPIADYRDPAGPIKLGGNIQFFLPDPIDRAAFHFERWRLAPNGAEPTDIMLVKDGRAVRFRRSW
jgi:hypothetical protein